MAAIYLEGSVWCKVCLKKGIRPVFLYEKKIEVTEEVKKAEKSKFGLHYLEVKSFQSLSKDLSKIFKSHGNTKHPKVRKWGMARYMYEWKW